MNFTSDFLKTKLLILFFSVFFIFQSHAQAMGMELGLNYGYQKKYFDANNYYQTETKSASVSFYLLSRIIFELSYTDSVYESQEKDSYGSRVVQQTSNITGGDLIFILTSQQDEFQPYLKAGAAYIHKKALIKYENTDAYTVPTKDGVAPSYGAGLKFKIHDSLSVRIGYDIYQTPQDNGTKSDDSNFKVGLSWEI